MKRLSISSAVVVAIMGAGLLGGLLAGCGNGDDGDIAPTDGNGGRLRVAATTVQIAALVREVAIDDVDLTVIIPAGVDPHDFGPSADDVRRIGDVDLLFKNGIGLDDFLDDLIEASGTGARVVAVTEGVSLIGSLDHAGETEAEEHGDDDHDDGEFDPHVWHDPLNAKVMVDNIAAALAEADAENAERYRERAEAYKNRLDEVDREIRELIGQIPPENRKIVSNHEALGYFIVRYELEFVGAVIPSLTTASEPSAGQVAALIDTIRREKVKAIFVESSVDPQLASEIARDTGITIVDDLYEDTLGEPGSGAETVDGMLLWNATRISEALR